MENVRLNFLTLKVIRHTHILFNTLLYSAGQMFSRQLTHGRSGSVCEDENRGETLTGLETIEKYFNWIRNRSPHVNRSDDKFLSGLSVRGRQKENPQNFRSTNTNCISLSHSLTRNSASSDPILCHLVKFARSTQTTIADDEETKPIWPWVEIKL